MKFIPTAEYTYWWPITVKRPHESRSGQWVTETFEMLFVAVDQDEADRIAQEIRALPTDAERAAREHDQIVNASRDWRNVTDGAGNEVEFSLDMLVTMLKAAPWYRTGIYRSYFRSLINEEVRKGN